jgi:hypothetical protein
MKGISKGEERHPPLSMYFDNAPKRKTPHWKEYDESLGQE